VTLDIVILSLASVFALWGFFAGAARQIATLLAGSLAWVAAGPLGQFYGPVFTKRLATSASIGVVLATLAAFMVVLVVVQIIATMLIRRVFAGHNAHSRTVDRLLGFVLGGAKVLAVVYVALCAMSFLETNVSIMGKKLAFTPKDSQLMALVRQYNLLEKSQFSGAHELVRVAQLLREPKAQQRLKESPDFVALSNDPRFTRAMKSPAMQKAIETGDIMGLIGSNELVELIQDPTSARRLERIGELLQ
jgi:membrane protein required for colicin V production